MNFPGIGDFGAIPLVNGRHTQREGIRARNRQLIHVQGKSLALPSSPVSTPWQKERSGSSLAPLLKGEWWGGERARQLRALGSLAEDLSPDTHTGRLTAYLPDPGRQYRLPDRADTVLTCRHAHAQIHNKSKVRAEDTGCWPSASTCTQRFTSSLPHNPPEAKHEIG